jgi:hypothetical protein
LTKKFRQDFFLKMHLRIFVGFVAGLFAVLSLAGCEKKSWEALVLGKEHIAAMETPPKEQAATPNKPATNDDEKVTELGKNDITVDQYVMSKDVRGTSRDPRATNNEQWLVKVRMIDGGRQFNVQADQTRFEKLKEGDRVKVWYRVGKYTGTVWDSEIR